MGSLQTLQIYKRNRQFCKVGLFYFKFQNYSSVVLSSSLFKIVPKVGTLFKKMKKTQNKYIKVEWSLQITQILCLIENSKKRV